MKLALALLGALALATAACNVNDYCIGCDDGDDAGDDSPIDASTIDARDGGGPTDACVPNGTDDECNGVDNDCDGTTDEDFPVGDPCGVDTGLCTVGVLGCTADGEETCSGVAAAAEECDGDDNDCDGQTDEGNPQGGAECGSDVGECVAGNFVCQPGGVLECVGDVGTPGQDPELCDGLDNDCDTEFDEGVATQGPCDYPNVGLCVPGTLTCVGGDFLCIGGQGPTTELCDTLDQDCDGDPVNGFDLDNDVANCGDCGVSCVGTIQNATERCLGGDCAIASCDPGFFDNPTIPGPDCLYACDFQGPVEACNQVDDDCDFDVDENLSPPPICDQDGECAGTVASCTANGFVCEYGQTVSTDIDGNIEPETQCDGLDNDCDTVPDDSFPTLGDTCDGAGVGECQDHGHIDCDPSDADLPPICIIDDPGDTDVPNDSETACDNRDEDCDGTVDENPGTLQLWVDVGGGTEIMKYEASRADADATNPGIESTYPCSRAGVQPWTMISQPDAEAACALVGGRLCTEQEWHRACSVVTGTAYPVAQGGSGDAPIFIEAEDYFASTAQQSPATTGVYRAWVPDYTSTFSGISALRASPDSGAQLSLAASRTEGPRLDYQVNFTQPGNTYVWVKMYRTGTSNNELNVGIAADPVGTAPTLTISIGSSNVWLWVRAGPFNVTTGTRFVSLYMREDGLRVDSIYVTRNSGTTAPTTTTGNGGDWSFSTNPDTFVADTCNGRENDTDTSTPSVNDDAILATGAKPQCFANQTSGGVFDLSGNVKEWARERMPDTNPFRGGASNNLSGGTTCANAFSLADDDFFFNNVGFRCCR